MPIALLNCANAGGRGRKSQRNWSVAWGRCIGLFTVFAKSPRAKLLAQLPCRSCTHCVIRTVRHLSRNLLASLLRILEISHRSQEQCPTFQKQVFFESNSRALTPSESSGKCGTQK